MQGADKNGEGKKKVVFHFSTLQHNLSNFWLLLSSLILILTLGFSFLVPSFIIGASQ